MHPSLIHRHRLDNVRLMFDVGWLLNGAAPVALNIFSLFDLSLPTKKLS